MRFFFKRVHNNNNIVNLTRWKAEIFSFLMELILLFYDNF